MTLHRFPPRELRADPIAVRDINTGRTIASITEDPEHAILQEIGRIGYVDMIEVAGADEEAFEVFTYRHSFPDKSEIVAYVGTKADRERVNDALFPMKEAAE